MGRRVWHHGTIVTMSNLQKNECWRRKNSELSNLSWTGSLVPLPPHAHTQKNEILYPKRGESADILNMNAFDCPPQPLSQPITRFTLVGPQDHQALQSRLYKRHDWHDCAPDSRHNPYLSFCKGGEMYVLCQIRCIILVCFFLVCHFPHRKKCVLCRGRLCL